MLEKNTKKIKFAKMPIILIIVFLILLSSSFIFNTIIGILNIRLSKTTYLEGISFVAFSLSPYVLVILGIWSFIVGLMMLKGKDERRILSFVNLIIGIIILISAILFYFYVKNFTM